MAVTTEHDEPESDERQAFRPYRRFVVALFVLLIALICSLIFRGIIHTLDRLPSAKPLERPQKVDARALRACMEDLRKLEHEVRKTATQLFKEPSADRTFQTVARPLEMERLHIVARCLLDEPGSDPAIQALSAAATAIEDTLRAYSLLYERHREDGLLHIQEAQHHIDRASDALRKR